MSNSQKNFMSIRSKLLAAVAMLLVASFMVVSSTYAWFTLSTAPEITGITTQVGANGNLEIALMSQDGSVPQTTIGAEGWMNRNVTWGNLVSLDQEDYGLGKVTLNPSVLFLNVTGNANGEDQTLANMDAGILLTNPLGTVEYSATIGDGRPEKLSANGVFGQWDGTKSGFAQSTTYDSGDYAGQRNQYGVSAIGTISTRTPQQNEYALAQGQVKTNLTAANALAKNTLEANGGGMVSVLLLAAKNEATIFTEDQVAPFYNMIVALKGDGTDGVQLRLGAAIKNYLIAYAASSLYDLDSTTFGLVKTNIEQNWETYLDTIADSQDGQIEIAEQTVTIEAEKLTALKEIISAYNTVATTLTTAETTYDNAKTDGFTFTEIKNIMSSLMNIDMITVNEKGYTEIKELYDAGNILTFATSCLKKTTVAMPEGSGVFADIAKLSGNVDSTFYSDIDVDGFGSAEDVLINMKTTLEPTEIYRLDRVLPAAPAAGTGNTAEATLTTTYAYVLDFAFRTNAAGSDLQLQTDATGRIYSDGSDTTQGGGSFMQFRTDSGSFAKQDIVNLMSNIRIIFADTYSGEIIAAGMLDTSDDGITDSRDEQDRELVKSQIVLCDDSTVKFKNVTVGGNNYMIFDFSGAQAKATNEKGATVLTSLEKNQVTNISVYVYLDGETVENGDVAADVLQSVVGNMNLQFSSSANLVPMNYDEYQGSQN